MIYYLKATTLKFGMEVGLDGNLLIIVFTSHDSGRGHRIGPVCVSVCLSVRVCVCALSQLNRLT